MFRKLATRTMRERPDLTQLKRQAKELLNDFLAGDQPASEEVASHYDGADRTTFALHHAQLVLARSYGFDSWPKLKAYVDGITIRRLIEAVKEGNSARVERMLGRRPELANMAVSYGDEHRAIHYAVIYRQEAIARLLMQYGANARAGIHPHRDATEAWTMAHERGYDEIVAIIEEEEGKRETSADPEPETPQLVLGDEASREAVARNDMEWLQARKAEGKLTNDVRWNGGGLLTVAVRNNHMSALCFLLDCGFDPNEHVSMGEGDWAAYSQGYPLWYAAAAGRIDMAELLLDHGADPNVHVDSSGSAVYSAYSHKQWAMADLLRARGGLVTPDIAGIYRLTDLAKEMLEAEARGSLAEGLKPHNHSLEEELLGRAASGGGTEIIRLALARIDWPRSDERWFSKLTEPLYFWHHIPWLYAGNKDFDRESYLRCFQLILERSDVNAVGSFGRTILHEIAAMRDHITDEEVTAFGRAALEAGARTNQRDNILQSTPLGWACRWGRLSFVQLLIEHGADTKEPDTEPWARPEAWAAKGGHTQILAFLKES